jgi:hypothetical protein
MRVLCGAMVGLVSVATAAGCGSDSSDSSNGVESKPPEQILEAMAKSLKSVKTFHFESRDRSQGRATADVGLPHELRLELRERTVSASLLVVRGSFFMKGNAAWWKDNDLGRKAEAVAGRWLKVPFSFAKDLTRLVNAKTFSHCLLEEHGTIARGGTAMVGGKRAMILIDKGDRPGSAPGKLYIAATGKPLPLRLIATGRERTGGRKDPQCGDDTPTRAGDEVIFSRYDEPLDLSPPPAAITFNGETAG